jgi:small subunit ribosomal protein S1
LAHGYVKTPGEVVKEGDEVEVKVLDVNRKKKQIKLSMKALEPVIEEFKPAKKEEKKGRGKRPPKKEAADVAPQEEKEPELTAMEIAWQEALHKSKAEKFKLKRAKSSISQEQEDLLDRTMKKRLPTGG